MSEGLWVIEYQNKRLEIRGVRREKRAIQARSVVFHEGTTVFLDMKGRVRSPRVSGKRFVRGNDKLKFLTAACWLGVVDPIDHNLERVAMQQSDDTAIARELAASVLDATAQLKLELTDYQKAALETLVGLPP